MYKNNILFVFLGLALIPFASARASGAVSEPWKLGHNMISSVANTLYFAAMNSNNQNGNMRDWSIDFRTVCNMAWASVIYGFTNYYESSYLPERRAADTLDPGEEDNIKWWINQVGSTVPMITLNTNATMVADRYSKTKDAVARYTPNEATATVLAGSLFLLRNIGFFYIIPPLLKPINHAFFKYLPKANGVAEAVYAVAPSRLLACAIFSATSLVYQELLISIKHLANQFVPQPATPLSVLRFDDCSRCWFGTNLFGKSGLIGSHLYRWRQGFLEWAGEWIREPIVGLGDEEEL